MSVQFDKKTVQHDDTKRSQQRNAVNREMAYRLFEQTGFAIQPSLRVLFLSYLHRKLKEL